MSIKIILWKFLKKSKKINFYYRNKNIIKHYSVTGILRYLNSYEGVKFISEWEDFYLKSVYKKSKIEILNNFLTEEKIKDRFYENLNNPKISLNITQSSVYQLISNAFIWKDTKEGEDKWYEIDCKYRIYLKNNFKLNIIYNISLKNNEKEMT